MTQDTEDAVADLRAFTIRMNGGPKPLMNKAADLVQSLSDRIDGLEGAVKLAVAHLTNAAAFAEGLGWLAVASEKREIAAEVSAALHQEGIAP